MEVLYFIGGFGALVFLFALIDRLHSRWAWRQSVREANSIMGRRPPPPVSPPGQTGGLPGEVREAAAGLGVPAVQLAAEIAGAAAPTEQAPFAWVPEPAAVRHHAIEAIAAACGLAGAWLLATKSPYAAWGWWAFLASNIGWIAFGWIRRHWFLLLQQVGFTASSLWGIWKWMGPS